MPLRFLRKTVYVRVRMNEIDVRHIEFDRRVVERSQMGFTTQRLLIGNFTEAGATLQRAMSEVHNGRWYVPSPFVLMHPLDMVVGGLSQVEDRVLRELATFAGARAIDVWVGPELTDQEVIQRAGDA